MIQIKQTILKNVDEKETMNRLNHEKAFELMPFAKSSSYNELLPGDKIGIYLTIKITNENNDEEAQKYVNGMFLPAMSVTQKMFNDIQNIELLSISYCSDIAENQKKECLLLHSLLEKENNVEFSNEELDDFSYKIAEMLNIKMPPRAPKTKESATVEVTEDMTVLDSVKNYSSIEKANQTDTPLTTIKATGNKISNKSTNGCVAQYHISSDEGLKITYVPKPKDELVKNPQNSILEEAGKDVCLVEESLNTEIPLLNIAGDFIPQNVRTIEDDEEAIYDIETEDKKIKLTMSYGTMKEIFASAMRYIMTVEQSMFIRSQHGDIERKDFMEHIERYLLRTNPNLPREDLPIILKRIENAVFEYYVLQKALEDPDVSDIKVLAWNHIRVKVKGKRMTSNLHFLDEADLKRFVEGVAIRNKTSLEPEKAVQNFTDRTSNEDYILRFNITTTYVNSSSTPYLHIRKVPKHKVTLDTLIERGMLSRKLADFLIDAVKNSRGLIFCGRGGSGKTSLMNALLEYIPKNKSGLVIQENEELFSNTHPDLMFQHTVISPYREVPSFNLRALATNGLLVDLDYFIIGETKGAEAADLMSAAYSGTITWTSIHCNNSKEALNKMADYVKLGTDYTFEQAKNMMTNMQYIIHLADYQVKDISEVIGFDHIQNEIQYRDIFIKE